jgi:ferredoxin-like protein FixX
VSAKRFNGAFPTDPLRSLRIVSVALSIGLLVCVAGAYDSREYTDHLELWLMGCIACALCLAITAVTAWVRRWRCG